MLFPTQLSIKSKLKPSKPKFIEMLLKWILNSTPMKIFTILVLEYKSFIR